MQHYRDMAGQVGDPTVPYKRKQAAIESIREIQRRYGGQDSVPGTLPLNTVNSRRKRYNPATGLVE